MKRVFRPNALPAKSFYKNNLEQQLIVDSCKNKKGALRGLIEDMCDYCLKVVLIKRDSIKFRRFGYKFGCNDCHKAGKFKWKKEGSTEKILPCFQGGNNNYTRNLINSRKDKI